MDNAKYQKERQIIINFTGNIETFSNLNKMLILLTPNERI